MKFASIASIAVLCSVSALALAQQAGTAANADDSSASKHEKHEKLSSSEFAKKAAAAGMAEVQLGKMGVEKATDPEVKAFAQQMVTDHTKANEELATLAKSKKLDTPDSPNLIHKVMDEKFEHQKAGKEFDQDFMKQMVKDHKDAVELFTAASTEASLDPDLKALAKKTLPTLQQHLKHAESLQAKLGK